MRIAIAVTSTLALITLCAPPAAAQTQQERDWCYKNGGNPSPDLAINGCAAVIQSHHTTGHNLAVAFNNRCIAYKNKGNNDQAIADCNQAMQIEPDYDNPYLNRGTAYMAKGNFDDAVADYTTAIRKQESAKQTTSYTDQSTITNNQSMAGKYYNRGLAYKAKGDLEAAIADYSQAIALDPKDAPTYNNRGLAYRAKGDLDHAIADFTQAIALNPKNALAYNNRGFTYKVRGDLDRAIADYSQAIAINPLPAGAGHINVYDSRGNAYYAKADFDRAMADYNQAITIDPKNGYVYLDRGFAYAARNENDHAIADYTQAIAIDPKYVRAYLFRGRAELYAGALPKALADLNQAAELNPKDVYAALWLDIIDKRSKLSSRLNEAVAQIDMTKWPAPVIRLFLGQLTPDALLAAADNPDPVTRNGQVCEANFYSGEFALQQGNRDDAMRLFKSAVADCPKTFVEYDSANSELKALGASP